ncbi:MULTISPECIES: hypothetical protein [unclassified Cyanobium]|uniref:hypothetical protein n=1 Tax=unclassified Cyanobium TaxID=2627006 RepID=UPI0020CCC9B6|nr:MULTISPECIES: hypothetical protein [unclassified Cyanobium]
MPATTLKRQATLVSHDARGSARIEGYPWWTGRQRRSDGVPRRRHRPTSLERLTG